MNLHDWADGVARAIIQRAARRAPPPLSERLQEEWLADLNERNGILARLRLALGCRSASSVIARELGARARPAAPAAAGKSGVVYADPGGPFLSRRTMMFVLILCLHTLVIYGLATGTVRTALEAIPHPFAVVDLPTVPTKAPEPPVVDLKLVDFRPEIPLSPWQPVEPPRQSVVIEDPLTPVAPSPSVPIPSAPVTRVRGGPGAGFPSTNEFYPQASIRMGERGIATVDVCVDGSGRLTGEPAIQRSSGSSRLDAGALKLAKAGSGHYRPTTEDGRPVGGCYAFLVRFHLED